MNKIIFTFLTLIFTSTLANASTLNDFLFNYDALKKITSESVNTTLEEIEHLNQLSISEQSEITFNRNIKNKKSIRIANSKLATIRAITLGE